MGSIHDAASTSSASSTSPAYPGNGSSTHHHRTPTYQSPSVASLRSRFEGLEARPRDGRPTAADRRPATGTPNRRGGSGEGTYGTSVAVDQQKSQRRATSTIPAAVNRVSAGRRSLGAGSTQPPGHRSRHVTPACKRNQEPETRRTQRRDEQGRLNFT